MESLIKAYVCAAVALRSTMNADRTLNIILANSYLASCCYWLLREIEQEIEDKNIANRP